MKYNYITDISYPIRLGQFLKLANIAQDGMEAKLLIQEGTIKVNSYNEKQRGKQLQKGDIVELEDSTKYMLR
jgi:ribosome-associated protein